MRHRVQDRSNVNYVVAHLVCLSHCCCFVTDVRISVGGKTDGEVHGQHVCTTFSAYISDLSAICIYIKTRRKKNVKVVKILAQVTPPSVAEQLLFKST